MKMAPPQTRKKVDFKGKTREDVLRVLVKKLEVIDEDHKRIIMEWSSLKMKYGNVRKIIEVVLSAPVDESQDGFKMDEEIPFVDPEAPEELEVDGFVYVIGDEVQLFDSKKKKWTEITAVLTKFCDKMAKMTVKETKKKTSRKYGYFRFPAEYVDEDAQMS